MKKQFSAITFAAQVVIGGKSLMSCSARKGYKIELNEQETMFHITCLATGHVSYVPTANQRWAELIVSGEVNDIDSASGSNARARTGKEKSKQATTD